MRTSLLAGSRLAYTSRSGQPTATQHQAIVQRIHAARIRRAPGQCRDTTVEPHESGEFPMTCYACHLVEDM